MPIPATADPLNGTRSVGIGSGGPRVLSFWPPGFGGVGMVGAVVLDGLNVVLGGLSGTVTGVGTRAVGCPAPHDASAKITPVDMAKRTRVIALGRDSTRDIGPG